MVLPENGTSPVAFGGYLPSPKLENNLLSIRIMCSKESLLLVNKTLSLTRYFCIKKDLKNSFPPLKPAPQPDGRSSVATAKRQILHLTRSLLSVGLLCCVLMLHKQSKQNHFHFFLADLSFYPSQGFFGGDFIYMPALTSPSHRSKINTHKVQMAFPDAETMCGAAHWNFYRHLQPVPRPSSCANLIFKSTFIISVLKHSSPMDLNDYRPVALTPIDMKCFEWLSGTGTPEELPPIHSGAGWVCMWQQ